MFTEIFYTLSAEGILKFECYFFMLPGSYIERRNITSKKLNELT
jgi:hypothetical protein